MSDNEILFWFAIATLVAMTVMSLASILSGARPARQPRGDAPLWRTTTYTSTGTGPGFSLSDGEVQCGKCDWRLGYRDDQTAISQLIKHTREKHEADK